MKKRIAIVSGYRTPFCKAGGQLKDISADDLGAIAVRELMNTAPISDDMIDEVIIGNVGQPANAANIARVIALKAGLPTHIPAYTVHRNCASGMESLTTAANKILAGQAEIIVCGGTESMSNIPLMYNKDSVNWFTRMSRAKSIPQKIKTLLGLRPHILKPIIGLMEGLTDPICGLNMGMTAENLARDFGISREEQDQFALMSHHRAAQAQDDGWLGSEIVPVLTSKGLVSQDDGPRAKQSMHALGKLRPYFIRDSGTVTAGNACPISDGACALLVMSESKANKLGLEVMGYLTDYAYAGCDGDRMGLGPVYATAKLLKKSKITFEDFERIELNEAFAAQAIACEMAFESPEFAKKHLGLKEPVGKLDWNITNVQGGAIALGHPVGSTGARLVLTLLEQMGPNELQNGLATLCIGGGQGAAMHLQIN